MKNRELPHPFIFNLGRIWQSVSCGDWSEAERLCSFVDEIGLEHSGLKSIRNAILKEDIDRVNKSLDEILGW